MLCMKRMKGPVLVSHRKGLKIQFIALAARLYESMGSKILMIAHVCFAALKRNVLHLGMLQNLGNSISRTVQKFRCWYYLLFIFFLNLDDLNYIYTRRDFISM